MKIHQIIRERRLAKHLTQEQVAHYLGVTAPAVNKWEKAISYPDITVLPALARLLDTDLNTLLSFQDDLTEQEVALFLNQVSDVIEQNGFAAGYDLAVSKLREFPTCDQLVCSLAMLLDGALTIKDPKDGRLEEYRSAILSLYRRAASSSKAPIREQALSRLIADALERQDYAGAQALLDSVSDPSPVDKRQIQANIFIAQGELSRAAKTMEEKLLSANNEIHAALMTLMEIAIKENRLDDADSIAKVDKQAAEIFDLWEYNRYVAQFQLYSACGNRAGCLKLLVPMLRSLTKKWDINRSPLYRHIKTKEVDASFGPMLQKTILNSLCEDKDTEFLKDSPELKSFLEETNQRRPAQPQNSQPHPGRGKSGRHTKTMRGPAVWPTPAEGPYLS